MNWIKENWFKVGIIIVLVFASTFLFYWYEWRPSETRKEYYSETYSNTLNLSAFEGKITEEQKQEIPKIPYPQGLTAEEQVQNWNDNLATFRQTANANGFSEEEINAEIERVMTKWRPAIKQLAEDEKKPVMCQYSKKELLSDAFSKGVRKLQELEELEGTYKLLCEE